MVHVMIEIFRIAKTKVEESIVLEKRTREQHIRQ